MLAAKSGGGSGDYYQIGVNRRRPTVIHRQLETSLCDKPMPEDAFTTKLKRVLIGTENYNYLLIFNIIGTSYYDCNWAPNILLLIGEQRIDTLLGDAQRRARYYDSENHLYYFERHAPSFDAILYYYQSGGYLHCPGNVPKGVFQREMKFFDIKEDLNEEEFKSSLQRLLVNQPKCRRTLFQLLEEPNSSTSAKLFGFLTFAVIVLSTVEFCLETVQDLKTTFKCGVSKNNLIIEAVLAGQNYSMTTEASSTFNEGSTTPYINDTVWAYKCLAGFDLFFTVESACVIWFTIEFLLRLFATPTLFLFAKSFMNWVDIVAVFPYYVNLALNDEEGPISSLATLRVLRMVRVLRIFKVSRHLKGIKVLGKTLAASWRELLLLVFFLTISLLLSGSALYMSEMGLNPQIKSIPDATWVCIVTLTTVGYGDVIPMTFVGKLVASVCAVMGAIVLALPISVIVGSFKTFYDEEKRMQKLKNDPNMSEDSDD